jgi:hypothetical protein
VTKKDIAHVETALKILSKKLTSEAENLDALGQVEPAQRVRADVGEIDVLMMEKVKESGTGGFNERQRKLARTAVGLLVKNTKAAKGTCLGIGHEDWAALCEEEAAHIESALVPMLEEQPELPTA